MNGVKNEKLSKAFGKKFRELRLKSGMSTREFADTAGIAHSQVHKIDIGIANPTISTQKAIADALGITLSQLMEGL